MSTLAGYEYTYTPLTSPDEFRLVHLNRSGANSSAGDLPSIEFVPARFDQACSYTALSYAWGTCPDMEYIQVKGVRPRILKIKKSLACALRSLWKSDHQVLWIDALCINQNNLLEKNHQVSRMAEIYRRATEVVIWLGEAENDSDLAMEFMKNISVKEIDKLAADPGSSKAWKAIATLMRRSWFKRRWAVQEVTFARHPVLRCGSAVVSWVRFCEVVELITEKIDVINQCVHDSQPGHRLGSWLTGRHAFLPFLLSVFFLPSAGLIAIGSVLLLHFDQYSVGELRGVGVHSLIAVYDRVLPRIKDGDEPRRLCTMEALLSYLPEFEATNGRDVVFALASLAKDYMGFTPDYGQSVIRVYKNAIEQAVATSHSLNIICRPWAQPLKNLPSWVLPHSALPFRRNHQGIYVRQHADTLVCLAHQSIYHASGSVCASTSFNDDETHFVLTCKGFQLPAIAWIGEQAEGGNILNSWHNSLKGANIEQKYLEEMYWRTLVADKDSKGNTPPYWYSLACIDAYELCRDGGLNTTKLLQDGRKEVYLDRGLNTLLQDRRKEDKQISSKLKEFLQRVQAVTWNRRLVKLADDSLGLVPERTIQYDRICILFGCDVPVVLRRLNDDTFEFIGEAFIYGVMNGEALYRPYEDVTFNLV